MLSRTAFIPSILLLAIGVGAYGADPVDRGPLNSQLPGWMSVGASARFRAEGLQGVNFKSDDDRGYVLQRYRFSTEIRPADWVRVFAEIQDSREAGSPRPGAGFKDASDLRQAFVGFGRKEDPWDLKVGRQKMAFGSERVIGAGEWGNVPRVFDAVRLGLHRGSDRVDVFSSSVVHGDTGPWDDHRVAGDNMHGFYAALGSLLPQSTIEPYVLRRTSPDFAGERGALGHLSSWTYGLRAIDEGSTPWGYEVEALGQRGDIGANALRSWAFTGQAQRRWKDRPWKPIAIAEFNFASGDLRPGDGEVGTFDQLYPTNHGIYGIVDQVGRRNTKNTRLGLWFTPGHHLNLKTEGHSFWLASRFDSLYGAGGGIVVPAVAGGADSTDIGREVDFSADWKPSSHYEVGFQVGHLFPGSFLKHNSPGFGRTFYTVFLALGI